MNIEIIGYLIIFLGVVNLLRITILLIGSEWYELLFRKKFLTRKALSYQPRVSIIIPAYNEEKNIIRCVDSVARNIYSPRDIEIIVIDDGSSDSTASLVDDYKLQNPSTQVVLVTQTNSGKANALNNGIRNYATGELIMCLDADSTIASDALQNAVKYFSDPKIQALSANVKIVSVDGILNLVQRFEYILGYQMKRALTVFNIEYIVGGVGSTFRKEFLDSIGHYDGDTITEDIDLTMKILQRGNNNVRVTYGADVIAYTESVYSIRGLIKQRSRWKWGRCQTFLKNKDMFFNSEKKFTKSLTWLYLPFVVFSDLIFLLEPVLIGYVSYLLLTHGDTLTILSAVIVVTTYLSINILMDETINLKDKIIMIILAPTMYFFFYILSYIEYVSLLITMVKLPTLKKSIEENGCHWEHVDRMGVSHTGTTD